MRKVECEFEPEVLAAVLQSRWPDRADPELRNHAKLCQICADVAAVAGAIECAREEVPLQPSIPDSGLMWWKAQMRARREAVEAAGRPITAVHVAAFAFAMALMGACIGATSSWFQAVLKWGWDGLTGIDVTTMVTYATALITGHGLLASCMFAMVFVVPVAVYLAIGKD